jgi:hypothetical protein
MRRLSSLLNTGGIYYTGNAGSISARIRRNKKALRQPGCGNQDELLEEIAMLQKTKEFMDWIKKNI